ncbi:MAG: polysaccharide export protein [Candidatus Scalindua sp.]|nr:polysaccharide export protein [Candidatus Scalindua sp.]
MCYKFLLKILLTSLCLLVFSRISDSDISAETLFDEEYHIGSDDILTIQVWDNDDLNRVVEVSKDGAFTFPLIGKVHSAGLTLFELENHLKKRLSDGYLVKPEVSVGIQQYRNQKVFLLGEIQKPGSYVLKRKTHILELISMAGGFTDLAGRVIKIVRPKQLQNHKGVISPVNLEDNSVITLDLSKYSDDIAYDVFYVTSGDTIYVNKISRIFVNGEIMRPGEFKWETGLTVREAVSRAGGYTENAALKRTKIIRLINGREQEIDTRMEDIVMPDDIIKVPGRYF